VGTQPSFFRLWFWYSRSLKHPLGWKVGSWVWYDPWHWCVYLISCDHDNREQLDQRLLQKWCKNRENQHKYRFRNQCFSIQIESFVQNWLQPYLFYLRTF
jgi:hypothetical protein